MLQRLQPLWDWLFLFRSGVLHADGEGYYDADDLIVEIWLSHDRRDRHA